MDLTGRKRREAFLFTGMPSQRIEAPPPERNLQPPAPLVCAAHKRWEKEFKLLRLI